jgi:hypothetical protein
VRSQLCLRLLFPCVAGFGRLKEAFTKPIAFINLMAEKPVASRKVSDKSTKQELMAAYQELSKQQDDRRASELNPERKMEEKRSEEALKVASTVEPEGIDREIGGLKAEVNKMLAQLSERLAGEAGRFRSLEKAVTAKQLELQELYGIEKTASSLAALIEAQNKKREDFEAEMALRKEELTREISTTQEDWDKQVKAREVELKERDAAEKKARDREKEQFDYAFKRDGQAMRDKLNDEKTTLEKDLRQRKEQADKDFAQREQVLAEREKELNDLRAKAATFGKELELAVDKAVKESSERLRLEAKNREDLLRKEFEGEKNVFTTRILGLEKSLKDLSELHTRMNGQLELAYKKVQEIAEKTIESAGQAKMVADLQKLLVDQNRKSSADK